MTNLPSNSKTWLLTIGFTALSAWVIIQTRGHDRATQESKLLETKIDGQGDTVVGKVAATLPGRFQIVRIHDGDTCEVIGSDGIRITVRLSGIDAPELAQAFGHEARQMLADLIANRTITLGEIGRDKYGRYLAQVYCDGASINREMLARGGAWAFLAGTQFDEFKRVEEGARTKHIGLWASEHPKPPWEARK